MISNSVGPPVEEAAAPPAPAPLVLPETALDCSPPRLGDRVLVSGTTAIVRWGPAPLPGQGSDPWLGIEYEEEGKGKHDGLLRKNGFEKRFFQCAEGQGSFVKAHKVVVGKTLIQGLEWKYSDEEVPLTIEDYKTQRTRRFASE